MSVRCERQVLDGRDRRRDHERVEPAVGAAALRACGPRRVTSPRPVSIPPSSPRAASRAASCSASPPSRATRATTCCSRPWPRSPTCRGNSPAWARCRPRPRRWPSGCSAHAVELGIADRVTWTGALSRDGARQGLRRGRRAGAGHPRGELGDGGHRVAGARASPSWRPRSAGCPRRSACRRRTARGAGAGRRRVRDGGGAAPLARRTTPLRAELRAAARCPSYDADRLAGHRREGRARARRRWPDEPAHVGLGPPRRGRGRPRRAGLAARQRAVPRGRAHRRRPGAAHRRP